MTQAKSKNPEIWLDIPRCKSIYETFRKAQETHKLVGEPLPPFETRYPDILESIVESVRLKASLLSFDVVETAVTYFVQLTKSQAFLNGNKRMAVVLTDMFLYLNGYQMEKTGFDLADLTLMVSEDHTLRIENIVELLTPTFRQIIRPKA